MFYGSNKTVSRSITFVKMIVKNDIRTLKTGSHICPRKRVVQAVWEAANAEGSFVTLGPSGDGRACVSRWVGSVSLWQAHGET